MATEPGKDGTLSSSKGPWIEGDHNSIGTGGGAPPNGGDGKQSLKNPKMGGVPNPDMADSGDEGTSTA